MLTGRQSHRVAPLDKPHHRRCQPPDRGPRRRAPAAGLEGQPLHDRRGAPGRRRPIGQDVNLSRYVFNNPVNFVDPLRLEGIYPIPLDGETHDLPTRCQKKCAIIVISCGMIDGPYFPFADMACTPIVTPICVFSCQNPPEYCDDEVNFPEGGA